MTAQNYTKTIQVKASSADAYTALTTDIGKWWAEPDAPITALGDVAVFTFPPNISHWTFKATTLTPHSFVELTCIDALHIHDGQPAQIEKEWLGTKLGFKITKTKAGTEITMTHKGLIPELTCYDICSEGWGYFFTQSLKALLDTGTGQPHSPP